MIVQPEKFIKEIRQYTCYAPLSVGVDAYIDSLYNDTLARIPHNGLTENSVDGLSEEQCKEIARYHLSAMMNSYSILTFCRLPFTESQIPYSRFSNGS